jgi:hypothetical protein
MGQATQRRQPLKLNQQVKGPKLLLKNVLNGIIRCGKVSHELKILPSLFVVLIDAYHAKQTVQENLLLVQIRKKEQSKLSLKNVLNGTTRCGKVFLELKIQLSLNVVLINVYLA